MAGLRTPERWLGKKGKKRTLTYQSWVSMRARCAGKYPGYEAVSVCSRWNSFDSFLADMGPRPSKQHTLDRLDNFGDYTPGNCRWATKVEQTHNRRCIKLSMEAARTIRQQYAAGVSQKKLADAFGVRPQTIACVTSGKIWKEPGR